MTKPPVYTPTPELEVEPGTNIFKTKIDGLYYVKYKKFQDNRGFFSDLTGFKNLAKATGKVMQIKQINLAMSHTNVVRGFHAEGWNKLITTFNGVGYSALVDLRPDSLSFKQIESFWFEPKDDNEFGVALYIPMGVANSICVVEGPLLYHYAVDAFYDERDPSGDKAINLFDPDINVQWPVPRDQMILSDRDLEAVGLEEIGEN